MRIRGFDRGDLATIAAAGVVGASLRWAIGEWLGSDPANEGGWFSYAPNTKAVFSSDPSALHIATLVPNLIGCAVLGAAVALRRLNLGSRRRLNATAVGFCASLTTLSTFAVEVALELQAGRLVDALAYVGISVGLGAIAFWFGATFVTGVAAP